MVPYVCRGGKVKAIIYALIGVVLYGVQNAIIDVKLKQYSTVSLLVWFYLALLPCGLLLLGFQKYTGQEIVAPKGGDLWAMVAVGVMFFIADYFYLGAYTNGSDVVTITLLLVLMPVIGAAVKFLWVGERPNLCHLAAFACATLAVVFVALAAKR